MELQQLMHFKIIAHTQNISQAAKQLYIAQPSLSQTLKRLENEVGLPLFDRIGKRIVLNEAGAIFLKYVDEVFNSLDNASRELKTYKEDSLTNVCISVQSASLLFPEIISEIQISYPKIKLQLLQHAKLDFMPWDLKIASDYQMKTDSSNTLLMEEPIGIVFPKKHPLASKQSLNKKDLMLYPFISLSPQCDLYNIISYYCEKEDINPINSTYVDSPNFMRNLLRMNLGIAFVPQYSWNSFYKDYLIFRKIDDLPMSRYVFLTWDENRYMTPSVNNCKQIIIDYFTKYKQKFQ